MRGFAISVAVSVSLLITLRALRAEPNKTPPIALQSGSVQDHNPAHAIRTDGATSHFTSVGPMNYSRNADTSTLLPSGRVLIIGRIPAEVFDSATNAFTVVSSNGMAPRGDHTATLLNDGKVLIAGGVSSNGETNTAELFDPATGNSASLSPYTMVSARYGHTATLLPTGKVLICGGQSNAVGVWNTAELFDPATGAFTPVAQPMSAPRYLPTATLLPNGQVLVAGGYSGWVAGRGTYTNTIDVFDATTETFLAVSGNTMNSPRSGHTATLLLDGNVLIAGGWNGSAPVNSAELFDPKTLTVTMLGQNMNSPRILHTATRLQSGNVLIAGGQGANANTLDTGELFIASSREFRSLSPDVLTSIRSDHMATLLHSGKVLIAGGSVNHYAVNTAELFDLPPLTIKSVTTSPGGIFVIAGTTNPNLCINIQASAYVTTGFTTIATVKADATGSFLYQEAETSISPHRFFRAAIP